MKVQLGMALAAALAFACSSGNRSTRTAGNDTGTTQPGSISGTQSTAAGANGTQATATTDSAGTTNQPSSGTAATVPSNTSPQGTTPPTRRTPPTPRPATPHPRASFDPASNRADKIEVRGRAKMKHQKNAADAPPVNPDGK